MFTQLLLFIINFPLFTLLILSVYTATPVYRKIPEPQAVFSLFDQICQIPHGSYHEAELADWLVSWEKERNFSVKKDETDNVYITTHPEDPYGPPALVFQVHLDMVLVNIGDHEPVIWYQDGDWIRAKNTTLGADNGIGLALALAVMEDFQNSPMSLGLIATVQEEIGLQGVLNLHPEYINPKRIINLDTSKEGVIVINSGGITVGKYQIPVFSTSPSVGYSWVTISVTGLIGGHSAQNIKKNQANGILVILSILRDLIAVMPIEMASCFGGEKMNVIPPQAHCVIGFSSENFREFEQIVHACQTRSRDTYADDPNLQIHIHPAETPAKIIGNTSIQSIINLVDLLPQGVIRYGNRFPGEVVASGNLAMIYQTEEQVQLEISVRYNTSPDKEILIKRLEEVIVSPVQGTIIPKGDAWEGKDSSPLIDLMQKVYSALFGQKMELLSTHGGIECGHLAELYPDADIVSIGIHLEDPHSIQERVSISSTERYYQFVTDLVKEIELRENTPPSISS
jgi:dipeptidase D